MSIKITKFDRSQALPYNADWQQYFEGQVELQTIVGPTESNELEILAVHFAPGARTTPHTHEQDQVLHIVSGQGIVATENEERTVFPGDVITIKADTWHWHGATAESEMCHISIKKQGGFNWSTQSASAQTETAFNNEDDNTSSTN